MTIGQTTHVSRLTYFPQPLPGADDVKRLINLVRTTFAQWDSAYRTNLTKLTTQENLYYSTNLDLPNIYYTVNEPKSSKDEFSDNERIKLLTTITSNFITENYPIIEASRRFWRSLYQFDHSEHSSMIDKDTRLELLCRSNLLAPKTQNDVKTHYYLIRFLTGSLTNRFPTPPKRGNGNGPDFEQITDKRL